MKYQFLHFKLYLGTLLTWVLLAACDPVDTRLILKNSSKNDIHFSVSCDSNLYNKTFFRPGYYVEKNGDSTYISSSNFIKKGELIHVIQPGINGWPNYVKNCKNNRIFLSFIEDSVLMNYTDEEIKNNRMFQAQYVFTLDQLESFNWMIEYK